MRGGNRWILVLLGTGASGLLAVGAWQLGCTALALGMIWL